MADVVRLNRNLGDLAIFGLNSSSLASDVAQQSTGIEVEVHGFGEGTIRVTEETDAAGFVWVHCLLPCVHANRGECLVQVPGNRGIYTKASLTETTKVLPALASFSGLLM